MTAPRVRVTEGLALGGATGRQQVLDEVADLEHKLYIAGQRVSWLEGEQAAILSAKGEAERLLNYEAHRAEDLEQLLQGVTHILRDDMSADISRRAIAWIERERAKLARAA